MPLNDPCLNPHIEDSKIYSGTMNVARCSSVSPSNRYPEKLGGEWVLSRLSSRGHDSGLSCFSSSSLERCPTAPCLVRCHCRKIAKAQGARTRKLTYSPTPRTLQIGRMLFDITEYGSPVLISSRPHLNPFSVYLWSPGHLKIRFASLSGNPKSLAHVSFLSPGFYFWCIMDIIICRCCG